MGRREAVANQNKSGVTREGICSESGNFFFSNFCALSCNEWLKEMNVRNMGTST